MKKRIYKYKYYIYVTNNPILAINKIKLSIIEANNNENNIKNKKYKTLFLLFN